MVLIYIGHDSKEDFLAKAFHSFINNALGATSGKDENRLFLNLDKFIEQIHNSNKTKNIALMLCSPFSSLRKTAIHAQCGALDYHNENGSNQTIHIVPICHSGLTSVELPAFFSSNQGLRIRSEHPKDDCMRDINNFGKSLLRSIFRIGEIDEQYLEKALESNDFYCHWSLAWKSKANDSIPKDNAQGDEEQSEQEKQEKQEKLRKWKNNIKEIVAELNKDSDITIAPDRDHIGILPFLIDGNDIYVGLKRSDQNPNLFHSNTEAINSIKNINEWNKNSLYQQNTELYPYIKKRLASMNHRLRKVQINGEREDVIALLNDSDEESRLDLCIPRLIKKDSISQNLVTYKKLLVREWIWAKDGVVNYWFFPKESDIPAFISQEPRLDGPVFLSSEEIFEKYGWNAFTTPYTSDEELGNKMGHLFTVSARILLTAF